MVNIDVQKRLIKMEVDDNEVQQRQQNRRPQKILNLREDTI